MRRFHLRRIEDVNGVSGTGIVTDGIEFDDGSIIMAWNSNTSSITVYKSIDDVVAIHGHEGRTVVEFTDEVFSVTLQFFENGPVDALDYLFSYRA